MLVKVNTNNQTSQQQLTNTPLRLLYLAKQFEGRIWSLATSAEEYFTTIAEKIVTMDRQNPSSITTVTVNAQQ